MMLPSIFALLLVAWPGAPRAEAQKAAAEAGKIGSDSLKAGESLIGTHTLDKMVPFVETDPAFTASPDPLSRTILAGQGKPGSLVTAVQGKGLAAPGATETAEVQGIGLNANLRDALNASVLPGPGGRSVSVDPKVLRGLAIYDSEPASIEAGPRLGAERAREQLEVIRRGARACGAEEDAKACADRAWGERRAQTASEAAPAPRR